jgi:hypothetical protein
MRQLLAALVLLLASMAPAAAGAQDGGADEAALRATVQQIIRAQNAAFGRDDGAAAFAFATPALQRHFGTPSVFMEMVRTAYPQVYRHSETEFRDFYVFEGTPVQRVLYVGTDNTVVIAHYAFAAQPDGSWRIMHVALLAAEDKAT